MTQNIPPDNVFVFYGALRSGTTLIRLMLDAHPDISCPGERDCMLDFLEPSEDGLVLDAEGLEIDRAFQESELSVPDTLDGVEAFWSFVIEDRTRYSKKVYVIVLHRGIDKLLQVFPEARIIHLLRDPRDVARSSIGMGWAGNTWNGVDHWITTESGWDQVKLDSDQVCTIHYEHLLKAPKAELTRFCAFMGLPFMPEMLTYDSNSTYEPVDPKLAYQWRHKQTPQEVSEVEFKVGALLNSRGYELSPAGPRAPSLTRSVKLSLQNKIYKWRKRIGRYGVWDSLLMTLGHRGAPRSWTRNAQLRINEKAKAYLK